MKSILENYTALQELWDAALETGLDAEVRSRIIGVKAQMESFSYFFGISVGELVLKHGDNLSKALQNESISAAEGQRLASLTVTTLTKIRDAEQFDLFWQLITKRHLLLMYLSQHFQENGKHPKDMKLALDNLISLKEWKNTIVKFTLKYWI